MRVGRERAAATYDALLQVIPDQMQRLDRPVIHAMRIPLDRPDGDYSLSVAFPPDYGYAETALFRGDELVYNEDWGYGDIRRGFGTGDPADSSTIDDLVAEIRRLGMNNPGHPDVSDSEPETDPEPEPEPEPSPDPEPAPDPVELLRQGFLQAVADQQTARYGAPLSENPLNDMRQYSEDPQQ